MIGEMRTLIAEYDSLPASAQSRTSKVYEDAMCLLVNKARCVTTTILKTKIPTTKGEVSDFIKVNGGCTVRDISEHFSIAYQSAYCHITNLRKCKAIHVVATVGQPHQFYAEV